LQGEELKKPGADGRYGGLKKAIQKGWGEKLKGVLRFEGFVVKRPARIGLIPANCWH